MKTTVDDWHFRSPEAEMLVLDVFLSNGQHALLEVLPMKNPAAPNGQIPELVVFGELPGEKLTGQVCPGRWAARPPDRNCAWSAVQIPSALMQQIRERLGYGESVAATNVT